MNRSERRRAAYRRMREDVAEFSAHALEMPLREYQKVWARQIYAAGMSRTNQTIVVEMSRQSGKNETAAQLEVALLAANAGRGGDIVKTAPTWKPQIVNSKRRFEARARQAKRRLSFLNFRGTQGYIVECGAASIQFLSASPTADVVGATASILLEVDEAQDVAPAKYDKDFAPMRASTGAPVALYGTAWTTDTLLAQFAEKVQAGALAGSYHRIPWDIVAAEVPVYGEFVQSEIRRLGIDHPLIRTQYLLIPLESGGYMLTDQQLRQVIGRHPRQAAREGEAQIVVGIDFAGADEAAGSIEMLLASGGSRDSVAVTVASVTWHPLIAGADQTAAMEWPEIQILDRYEWTNVRPDAVHHALIDIVENKWQADRIHCDATGIGETSTAFLAAALPNGAQRVVGQKFDAAWKTHTRLAFNLIAQINSGRLHDYATTEADGDPLIWARASEQPPAGNVTARAWHQRGHARLEARPGQRVRAYVPDNEGHDDLLIADMLAVDAALAGPRPYVNPAAVSTVLSAW